MKSDKKEELTQDEKEIKKDLENLKQKISERENNLGFKIGFTGEAYVFEDLQRLKCFDKIQWDAQTNDHLNPSVTLNNNYIQEDLKSYDILATDKGGKKYFFEVKSTDGSSNRKWISDAQTKFCGNLSHNNRLYIKAKVIDTLSDHPTISYHIYDPKTNHFKHIDESEHTDMHFMKSLFMKKNGEENQKLPKLEQK